MKNFVNENSIMNSTLYKKNIKIHNNLWKFYGISLILGLIFILLKGLN